MSLDSIVQITISAENAVPTEANFGTPLIACETPWLSRVRTYTDPAEMLEDGFTTRHAGYQCAKKMWSQSPHPDRFKIGKRDAPAVQALTLTPINTTEDFEYEFTVITPDMVEYEISHTVTDSDTVATIIDALMPQLEGVAATHTSGNSETFDLANNDTLIIKVDGTLITVTFLTANFVNIDAATAEEIVTRINAVAGFTLASGTTTVTLTSPTKGGPRSTLQVVGGTARTIIGFDTTKRVGTGVEGLNATDNTTSLSLAAFTDGELFGVDLGGMDPLADISFSDDTPDPGLEDDLNAILAADSDWYGLALDSNSPAEVAIALAWTEAQIKIGHFDASESEICDPDEDGDLFSNAKALGYARSYLQFSFRSKQWGAAALLSRQLTTTPGTSTWAHKNLNAIKVDTLGTTYETAILAKGGNVYRVLAGLSLTYKGVSPAGEWLDTTHFLDFIRSRLQTDSLAVLANNEAVPFTDTGAQLLGGTVRGRLMANVSSETRKLGFAQDPAPTVTVGRVADVSTANRGNRHFPDIDFGGRLSGAIHTLAVKGKVTV